MTDTASLVRKIFNEARPLVEQALDLTEQFASFRELATTNGLDWSQIKALLKAQVQDERAGEDGKRVDRIIEKADFASAYADMLGLGTKMNENNFSADPPFDPETGELITSEALVPPGDGGHPTKQETDDASASESAQAEVLMAAKSPEPAEPIHDDLDNIPAFLDRRNKAA